MATKEYLIRYIESSKSYGDLPQKLKVVVSEEEWSRRVKEHCMNLGVAWEGSPASKVCEERTYYESLVGVFRASKRIFPYHLGEYICRILRVSPFKYYTNILADTMKDDKPYDSIPNFTASDALRVTGIGRNQYIAVMQQAKSKLMWRMNKGLVRDLLPQMPIPPNPEKWWRVCVVNLGEVEYRTLSACEAEACRLAANYADGAPYKQLDPHAVLSLYSRGLVWFNIPIQMDDQVSIPPLEGFISNKTSSISEKIGDPVERLLYQVFVAASDRVRVGELAEILNVPFATIQVAISIACRLGFCKKLLQDGYENSPSTAFLRSPGTSEHAESTTSPGVSVAQPLGRTLSYDDKQDSGKYRGLAFVVDSDVTGFLMMGALTPEVKKHSVTLFEGGRVYGAAVISELIGALDASVEIAKEFEGEMASLAEVAYSVSTILKCLSSQADNRPIELLRKESMEALSVEAAMRILSHSYEAIIPAAGLPSPPLPCSFTSGGPTNFGPLPICMTPWLNLCLYQQAGSGPESLIIPAGYRISHLPSIIPRDDSLLLIWRWDAEKSLIKYADPLVLPARSSLSALNSILQKTAIMIQYIPRSSLPSVSGEDDHGTLPRVASLPLPLLEADSSAIDYMDDTMYLIAYDSAGEQTNVKCSAKSIDALRSMRIDQSMGSLQLLETEHGSWIPFNICLGIPLTPTSLCEAICIRIKSARLLSRAVMDQQKDKSKHLCTILWSMVSEYSSPAVKIDDPNATAMSPAKLIQFDGKGAVSEISGDEYNRILQSCSLL